MNDTVSSLAEVLKRFDEIKHRFEIPTQICVLGHITTHEELRDADVLIPEHIKINAALLEKAPR
ncbi:ethanolamine ammonia-lyase subunit EutB, partial [Intestinimonas massiliensis (ex Afouda et al. 2020)]|uniref:ethanolamine ammonia-lyase subunit EutB n=1 Tax=Intestinimonas massiliensis (ex Afouda et al. 2020) TaxID=1673721 RepID=UPI003F68ABEA